jgi:hypothetical protein
MPASTVSLTLPLASINVILGALGELPLKHSINVFLDIKAQVDRQVNPPAAKPAAALEADAGT